MPRAIANTLLLTFLSLGPAASLPAQAADVADAPTASSQRTASARHSERPLLALVITGARSGEKRVQRDALKRSLESSLTIDVATRGPAARATDLGTLSVMVSDARTTLLWTLPDGRSGLAQLRTKASGSELHEQVVSAAQNMLSRFGVAPQTSLAALR